MKKVKYLFSALIILLLVCVPTLMFVGCKKHYTVAISVAEGNGDVFEVDKLKGKKSLLGNNDVEEDTTFNYSVTPSSGYKIKYIKVDGEEIEFEISSDTGDSGYGISRPSLGKVRANHTIIVAFEKREYSLTFAYGGDEFNVLQHNGQVYSLSALYETRLNQIVANIGLGEFIYDDIESGVSAITGNERLSTDMLLITTKTEQELKEFLGLTD